MFSLFPEIRKFIPFYFIGKKKTWKNVTIYLDRFGNKKSTYSVMLILSQFFFFAFYAPPPESGGVLCYTLRNFECPSVRPSVCLSVRPSVRPSIRPSAPTTILVSATPPTVLGQSFWNFTGVLRMVWRYAYCFFRILKLFFITFFPFLT